MDRGADLGASSSSTGAFYAGHALSCKAHARIQNENISVRQWLSLQCSRTQEEVHGEARRNTITNNMDVDVEDE